jgi:hypothetical protein
MSGLKRHVERRVLRLCLCALTGAMAPSWAQSPNPVQAEAPLKGVPMPLFNDAMALPRIPFKPPRWREASFPMPRLQFDIDAIDEPIAPLDPQVVRRRLMYEDSLVQLERRAKRGEPSPQGGRASPESRAKP